MPNSPSIPARGYSASLSEPQQKRARLQAVPPPPSASAQPAPSTILPVTGPRKLVRPALSARALNRAFLRRDDPPVLSHQQINGSVQLMVPESSNAEAFYFQKQMQTQTPIVIVLEDGQQIEGWIEWFDKNCIKIRGAFRMLVYKASIKYIYKAADKHP